MTTPSFRDFGLLALDLRAEQGIRGIESERNRFMNHIAMSAFAKRPLDEIRPVEIRDWLRSMQQKKALDTRGDRLLDDETDCARQRTVDRRRASPINRRSTHQYFRGVRGTAQARLECVITSTCMPKAIDLTGRKFNRLTVVAFNGSRPDAAGYRRRFYLVRCDCGVEKELAGIVFASGATKSCGCLRNGDAAITHGHTRGGWSSEYRTWQSMIRRCHTPGASGYVKYGAQGIVVCQRWRDSFQAFLADVGPRPSSGHSIDRYPDTKGDYEPGNVRWATLREQARNKTTNRALTIDGQTALICEWAERTGTPAGRISERLAEGWSERDAVMVPKGGVRTS